MDYSYVVLRQLLNKDRGLVTVMPTNSEFLMEPRNRLDNVVLNTIAALLHDVQQRHGLVFNITALNKTLKKVSSRYSHEGTGFLTKTLLRLGKAFDKALSEHTPLNAIDIGFDPYPGCKFPRFLGELFKCVLRPDGTVLQYPDATCVESIRQIVYAFSKYELPYTDEQVQQVISKFERTESDLSTTSTALDSLSSEVAATTTRRRRTRKSPTMVEVAREAKILLSRVFSFFNPRDIVPRHGPGAVATKQRLWDKFKFTNVSSRITAVYPLDEYYYASLGHVCDDIAGLSGMSDRDLPARVCLVPKDSRGPRLISCEPVDFQWIQQGLARRLVEHVENIALTKYNVFFTDQGPNGRGAFLGSKHGRYATLDLNEASDRISLSLVRLLFPEHITVYLEACRSTSTELPDGRVLPLKKYAPMGSSLCFPVLALSVWALLTAGAPDADTRESILVYGDDVIVPTAYAANAMSILESFGLKINQDKSCFRGFFRESCGTDAFQGVDVTPVRFRTVWTDSPSPESYCSWIAYANQLYDKKYYRTYDYIVSKILSVYREVPSDDMSLTCPSLRSVPEASLPKRRRWNKNLQKFEYRVYVSQARLITHDMPGWLMLLRFFTEGAKPPHIPVSNTKHGDTLGFNPESPFSVRQYTKRKTSMLVKRWR